MNTCDRKNKVVEGIATLVQNNVRFYHGFMSWRKKSFGDTLAEAEIRYLYSDIYNKYTLGFRYRDK